MLKNSRALSSRSMSGSSATTFVNVTGCTRFTARASCTTSDWQANLRSRLKGHLRARHGESWDRFSVYLTIGDSHIKELESLILRMASPAGNRMSGKFAKSEDLCKRLAWDIREMQRLEAR